jgi:hypothetical protein
MQIELIAIWLAIGIPAGYLTMLSDHATTGIIDRESVMAGLCMLILVGGVVATSIVFVQTMIMFCFGWTP